MRSYALKRTDRSVITYKSTNRIISEGLTTSCPTDRNVIRRVTINFFKNIFKRITARLPCNKILGNYRVSGSVCAHAAGHLPTLLLFSDQTLAEVIELLSQDGNQLLLAL